MEAIRAMVVMGRTTISVSEDVADKLHEMKQRGESYDDVLRRVLTEVGKEVDEE